MNVIIDAVDNFLKSDDTRAFQINGDWGVGKTYFTVDKLIPHINSNSSYKCIYLSVNGIEKYNDFIREINKSKIISLAKNNQSKRLFNTAFDLFECFPEISIEHVNINLNKVIKKAVKLAGKEAKTPLLFILDDLERTSIDIKSIFGFISRINDNNSNKVKDKVVLICNEEKINCNEYKSIKEKAVSKTVFFGDDNLKTAQFILKSKIEKLKLRSDLTDWILEISADMFNTVKSINLRIILDFLYNFEVIARKLNAFPFNDKELQLELFKIAYASCFPLTFMLETNHEGGIEKFIENEPTHLMLHFVPDYECTKYLKRFDYSSCHEFTDNVKYLKDFYNLVKYGFFDCSKYVEKLSTFRLKELSDRFFLDGYNSDKELKQLQSDAFNGIINSNNLDVNSACNILFNLYKMKDEGLLFIGEKYLSKIYDCIRDKIRSIKYNPDFGWSLEEEYKDYMKDIDKNGEIKRIIKENRKEGISSEYNNNVTKVLNNKFYLKQLDAIVKSNEKDILKEILSISYFKKQLTNTRSLKGINSFFKTSIDKNRLNKLNITENDIDDFTNLLETSIIKELEDKVAVHYCKTLVSTLKLVREKI